MDVHQLEVLRELGDRGSVAAVADALYVTPSAVSQTLSALQRSVPVPLTERRGRTLALTGAGRALAEASIEVATALTRAREAVQQFLDEQSASVRVAAFHSAARTLFPPLLADLARIGGPVVECCDEDVAQDDFPALTADYDIVLAHRPDGSRRWPATLSVATLMREPLDVALPPGHRLVGKRWLSPSDVAGEPWIAVHEGFPLLGALDTIGTAAGHSVRIVHRINEFAVASAVVAAGGGLALMPRYTTGREPGVVLRPLRGVRVVRRIEALMRPDRAARRAVRTVRDQLRAIAAAAAG
jgi:DNA-binding transcriptional LysR family regulator